MDKCLSYSDKQIMTERPYFCAKLLQNKHKMRMKTFLVSSVCCICLLTACQPKAPQKDGDSNYPLMTLKQEDRQLSITYSAVIEGKQDVEIRPQV